MYPKRLIKIKDHLMVMFGGTVMLLVNCKLKPIMIYTFENPFMLKGFKEELLLFQW